MDWLIGLGKLFSFLVGFLEKANKNAAQREAQESSRSIDADPVNAWRTRFGVRDNEDGTSTSSTKTDTGEHDGK